MAYATYDEYLQFGGTMQETDFYRLVPRASAYLDAVTFDRISEVQDDETLMAKVKAAYCAVADAYLLNEKGGGIASESNDGVSVTYAIGVSNAKSENQRLREAVSLHLGSTGLLYRGVC